jgi:hypothetical protein
MQEKFKMKKSAGTLVTFSLLRVFALLIRNAGPILPGTHSSGGMMAQGISAHSFSTQRRGHSGYLSAVAAGSSSSKSQGSVNKTGSSGDGMTGNGSGARSSMTTGTAENQSSAERTINPPENHGNFVYLPESPGYDTKGFQALIDSGDQEAVTEWIQAFVEEHCDERSAPPQGHRQSGLRSSLDLVKSPGYDNPELPALIDNGDPEAVKEWMKEFSEEQRR